MTWLIFAAVAPFLFALTNHIDKILLSRHFTKVRPTTLLLYTAVASAIVALAIVLVNPSVLDVPLRDAGLMFGAGIIYYLAIMPFIKALSIEEASRVIPIFQIQPVLAYSFGFVLFGETITLTQMLAGVVVVVGAVLINLDLDNRRKFKLTVFGLVALSCILFMIESVAFKFVGGNFGFWAASFYQYFGTAVAGLCAVALSSGYRNDFARVWNDSGMRVFVGATTSAMINMGGRMSFNYALLLAPLVLVQLIQSTQSIFVLVIGTTLALFIPKYGKENTSLKHMAQKVASIVIVLSGTALLLLRS